MLTPEQADALAIVPQPIKDLADTFASSAMQAIIMTHERYPVAPPVNHYARIAQDAYLAAEAMLVARLQFQARLVGATPTPWPHEFPPLGGF